MLAASEDCFQGDQLINNHSAIMAKTARRAKDERLSHPL
jgi:hypothetical protein